MNHPVFRAITETEYQAGQQALVRNVDIEYGASYLMMARFARTPETSYGALPVFTERLFRAVGSMSLMLSLYSPDIADTYTTIEGEIEQGIILPTTEHPSNLILPAGRGSLGIFQEGYLISEPRVHSRIGAMALHPEPESEALDEPSPLAPHSRAASSGLIRIGRLFTRG